jgi:hypothetical protein
MSMPQQTLFGRIITRLSHAAVAVRAMGRRRVEIRGTPRVRRFLLLFAIVNIWPLGFHLSRSLLESEAVSVVFGIPFLIWVNVPGIPLQSLGFPQFRITDFGPYPEGPLAYGAILFFWTIVAYIGSWRRKKPLSEY